MDILTQPVPTGTEEQVPASPRRGGRLHRLLSGRPGDPRWARPALLVLLGATAVLYLWGLGVSGWANSFYSAAVRAVGEGRTRWLVLAGCLIGTGFLAKMLQTVLVVPGFALAYLIAGPVTLRRRIVQLLVGAGSMVVSAMLWVVAVMAVPASARPYIGGSQ